MTDHPTMLDVDQTAEALTSALVPIVRRKIAELGVMGSGAYRFYDGRTASGEMFLPYEVEIARFVMGLPQPPIFWAVHDVGAGLGELAFLLAACGMKVCGHEADTRRYVLACELQTEAAKLFPPVAEGVALHNELFEGSDAAAQELVITTNILTTNADEIMPPLIDAISAFKAAIVDISRFCVRRDTDEERVALIQQFAELGMTKTTPMPLSEGAFYFFERAH